MGEVVPLAGVVMPDPPSGMLSSVVEEWGEFWRGELAGLVKQADVPALERLFLLRDEQRRLARVIRAEPLVMGSQGQMVLNPLARYAQGQASELRQLEDRFGLSPMARLKLGVTFGDAARSLSALELDDDGDDGERFSGLGRLRPAVGSAD